MINLFNNLKNRKRQRESVPQLTVHERKSLEFAGTPPAALPYTTYDEMERDGMIQTALTIKKLGVLATPWRVVTDSDSSEARARAAFVEEAFQRMDGSPLTVLGQAMDAFAKGWSVQEAIYFSDGRRLWLRAVRPKNPALFGLEVDAFARIRTLRLQLPGEPVKEVPREKFVLFFNRPSYGRTKGKSDLDAAYRHWQAKSALLAAWRLHLERFASPTVLGRFQRGLPSEEQAHILSALQNLHDNTAIVFPNEIDISRLGGDREASSGFMEAIEFHNREMARAILGQTLTTDEGRRVGSLALGRVHLQVLLLQLETLRRELADVVMTEQVIRPLVELNFGQGPIPRFEFEPAQLKAFSGGEL
jgi:phage gp29-like protein